VFAHLPWLPRGPALQRDRVRSRGIPPDERRASLLLRQPFSRVWHRLAHPPRIPVADNIRIGNQ